jgi:hypothetical protein
VFVAGAYKTTRETERGLFLRTVGCLVACGVFQVLDRPTLSHDSVCDTAQPNRSLAQRLNEN